jgi:alkanesulfonate monooxygenase SsuD/methylene tetrahydromethanopterin reductase-like flavin-dependent oxidoreductase (luciferase family)
MPVADYRHKLQILAVGRDPSDIRKSLVVQAVVAEDERELEERVARLAAARATTPEALRSRGVFGTPEQIVETLLPYVREGVGDFILGARPPADYRTLELVAKRVAPALREEAKSVRA